MFSFSRADRKELNMKILIAILLVTNTIAAACYGFQCQPTRMLWHLFLAGMSLKALLK